MADGRSPMKKIMLKSTRRNIARGATAFLAAGLLATGGVFSDAFTAKAAVANDPELTEYSISDLKDTTKAASRDNIRQILKRGQGGATENASVIKVSINGADRYVTGENFTDVKSVLAAGNITLEAGDSVEPGLSEKVDESTIIKINRAGAVVDVTEEEISYNTIRKEDPTLPEGTTKVQTAGEKGTNTITKIVNKVGDRILSSIELSSFVSKAPVEEVILVGTKKASSSNSSSGSSSSSSSSSNSSSSSGSVGTTTPVGEMQQWAHDYLLANGFTEEDFTALVYIINHESGWNVHATNPSSGAYGLPQALPGSKMASIASDWHDNYQTQIKWFIGYCNRYGGIQGAYKFWVENHWY